MRIRPKNPILRSKTLISCIKVKNLSGRQIKKNKTSIEHEDFARPTRMDTSSNLINQCSGCNQSQNIEIANKSTKQSPQEGRHKFNVETLSREKKPRSRNQYFTNSLQDILTAPLP